jgi:excisionase family DNA binding protein
VEDQLIAGLTARQLLRLVIAASLAYGMWDQAPWLADKIRLVLAVVLGALGVVFALLQPGGRPLDEWLLAASLFFVLPRRLVWRPGAALLRRPRSEQVGWAELELNPEWLEAEPDREPELSHGPDGDDERERRGAIGLPGLPGTTAPRGCATTGLPDDDLPDPCLRRRRAGTCLALRIGILVARSSAGLLAAAARPPQPAGSGSTEWRRGTVDSCAHREERRLAQTRARGGMEMRKFQALNISDADSARAVEQAGSPGRATTTPNTDGVPRRGLLRVEEAAAWLGLSKRTLYELLSRGEIQSVHIGRSRRIAFTVLERYVERLSSGFG